MVECLNPGGLVIFETGNFGDVHPDYYHFIPSFQRRAIRVVGMRRSTCRYCSHARNQDGLRQRLKELAATHVRYGYRRLTVLLRREGWPVNAKRIYRLYSQEGLIVRTKQRNKIARRERSPFPVASRPNQCWSMDFVSDKLADGRSFRILTVVDQFTRECVWLEADSSMTGAKVVAALSKASAEREGPPISITCDNGSEFASRVVEAWAIDNQVSAVLHSSGPARGKRICGKL
jgi:putative transposase